jgi:hypothetical protein
MAIDALPPEEVTDTLRAARDEIWAGTTCEMHLQDLLHKVAKAVRHAQRQLQKAAEQEARLEK